jgi:hypothetical protein
MAEKVSFAYQDAGLIPGMEKIRRKADEMDAEWRKNARSIKEVERAAKQGFQNALSPLENYNRRMANLTQLLKEGKINQDQFEGASLKAEQALQRQGKTGTAAIGAIARQMTGVVAATFSVSSAIMKAQQAYEVWKMNAREAAEESRRAAGELSSFLALQEGGEAAERAQRVQALALEFGIKDRGLAYDTVQAMQSVRGDFEEALIATREVFAASQVDIPVELGKELETAGAAAKAGAGEYTRLAEAAGQASGRTPKAIAAGVQGVKQYVDPVVGFAVAAELAATQREGDLRTFVKAAGMALSTKPGTAQDAFAAAGLRTAGQFERIQYLAKTLEGTGPGGKVLPADVARFGIVEIRAAEAVSDIVNRATELTETVKKTRAAMTDHDLLRREREEITKQSPQAILDLGINQATAEYKEAQAADIKSLLVEYEQRTRGAIYARRGLTQAGPSDLVDAEGRATGFGRFMAGLYGLMDPGGITLFHRREAEKELAERMAIMREQLNESRSQKELLEDLNKSLKQAFDKQYRERRQKVTAPE